MPRAWAVPGIMGPLGQRPRDGSYFRNTPASVCTGLHCRKMWSGFMYYKMGRLWLILACIEPVVEPTGKARSRNQSDKPNKVRAKSKLEAGFR